MSLAPALVFEILLHASLGNFNVHFLGLREQHKNWHRIISLNLPKNFSKYNYQYNYFPCIYIQAFNKWLRIPEDKKKEVQEITQMLHNASLVYV